jgi:hypothetical protein
MTCISSTQGFFPYKLVATPEELKSTVESLRKTKTKSEFERRQLEKIALQLESDTSANLQLALIPITGDFENGIQNQAHLMASPPRDGEPHGMAFTLLVSYPASRGSVHITSNGKISIHALFY